MSKLSIQQKLKWTAFETGYRVVKEKWLAIVWMSVGNSYFGKKSINDIVEFVNNTFSQIKNG